MATSKTGNIYEAMTKVMIEVEPIAKDKQGHGYKFRGIDDVYAALQMIMARNGVFCVPEVIEDRTEDRTSSKGAQLIYRVLKIKYHFYATDGSTVSSTVIGEGMDSGDKASNKAMSVAQKYALIQAFCIPTSEPKDPENDNHEVGPPPPPYTGTNEQKIDLFKWCEAKKIKQADMKEVSDAMMSKPFTKEVFEQITKEWD